VQTSKDKVNFPNVVLSKIFFYSFKFLFIKHSNSFIYFFNLRINSSKMNIQRSNLKKYCFSNLHPQPILSFLNTSWGLSNNSNFQKNNQRYKRRIENLLFFVQYTFFFQILFLKNNWWISRKIIRKIDPSQNSIVPFEK
jgi:hypothetical protein